MAKEEEWQEEWQKIFKTIKVYPDFDDEHAIAVHLITGETLLLERIDYSPEKYGTIIGFTSDKEEPIYIFKDKILYMRRIKVPPRRD